MWHTRPAKEATEHVSSRIRTILRVSSGLLVMLTLGGLYVLLYLHRPPALDPALEYVPVEALPDQPSGYPTRYATAAAYFVGRFDIVDYKGPQTAPPHLEEFADVTFVERASGPLQLDVLRPEALDAPAPGVLLIHGGSFRRGHRDRMRAYAVALAERGYVAVPVDHRFAPAHPFPAAVQDIHAALRHLRDHAAPYGIDPERLVIFGASSGANLGLMAAYATHEPAWREGQPAVPVAGVIDLYGPVDLADARARDHWVVTDYLGATFAAEPARFQAASPLHHVHPGVPPTLIMQGTTDRLVPVDQSDALARALRDAGVTYWYDRIENWPHGADLHPQVRERVLALVDAFIAKEVNGAARQVATGG